MSRAHALTSGTKLGPYEIQSLLGAGGMGEVYRARDTRLERDAAIKILPQALTQQCGRVLYRRVKIRRISDTSPGR
jgi:serine/threonine protein kinase